GIANGVFRGGIGEWQLSCQPRLERACNLQKSYFEMAINKLPHQYGVDPEVDRLTDQIREDYNWGMLEVVAVAHLDNLADFYRKDAYALHMAARLKSPK